jgi:hypothetical protein
MQAPRIFGACGEPEGGGPKRLACAVMHPTSNFIRPGGSIWGPARDVNYAANAMGRFTTLSAFLSQWASCSQADGPTNLARTSVPVLLFEHTADGSTFPSARDTWLAAAGKRAEPHRLAGGNHYLAGQPHPVEEAADRIAAWAAERL